ncbi:MAG TPA: thioredoxin domain-containing protein, partial [Balneolaceae bacterium]|nr:thioredoxin domain-containing protein [Balneolaceae bacterium]
MASDNHQNKLAKESSPYLLQHAENPVDWYPWDDEAFEKARRENKPVFLSIGYATCHWCHVMAHESFEDEEIAELMNDAFVNIKVDREERPDIDNTYMLVCQMLTGSGGWPLNVLLTPDKKPFYAATYIPKSERHGRPGMRELIPWLSNIWQNEPEKITQSSSEIIDAFQKSTSFESGDRLQNDILDEAFNQYERQFDEQYGGFGSAPKFPSPQNLMLLLRYAGQNESSKALEMAEKTLVQMRMGGIFDQIGFGFHRYSTDRKWLVPHFEKMLYDQAMLLLIYTEAWQLTQNDFFKTTADEIITYLKRKMQDESGGFYSAEDADSEGKEGKFYVWTIEEIREALPAAEAELAIEVYNLIKAGNYEDEATGRRTGKNIPHLQKSLAALSKERDMQVRELQSSLKPICKKLLKVREKRVHPLLDDKILIDWNGLMIAALAKAGRAFQNEEYVEQAKRCFTFISAQLMDKNDELKHRWRNGDVAINAHADDYAFLIWGLIELYEATFESRYLQQAVKLNQKFIDQFWDREKGGFYFTPESDEQLLGRKKEIYDGALPSSNSVAMMNLLRLGRLTGQTKWEEMADEMNQLFSTDIRKAPTGFGFALLSIDFTTAKAQEIVIVGKKEHPDTQ